MKTTHQNFAAVALLRTQAILLNQAKRRPKTDDQFSLLAAKAPIWMMLYASQSVQKVAIRIGNARIERFVRERQGRRLPA